MLGRTMLNRAPFGSLSREMDRLFESMLPAVRNATPAFQTAGYPAFNVWETEESLFDEAELPGVKTEDLDISIQNDELSIRGQRHFELPDGATALRRERFAGSFERVMSLPVAVDAEAIEATLRNGILLITLPKATEARSRKIEIKG